MTKKIIFEVLGVLAVVVIVLGVNYFTQSQSLGSAGAGPSHYQTENFLQGLFIGGANATKLSQFSCASASWNPGSVGTTTVNAAATSTDIALPGAVMGDIVVASLSSATSSVANITGYMSGNATATIRLLNVGTSALDITTGTAKVCYIH